ncbi:Hypothetical_protein [Hexamita inflata]|uniref:Hypothetical_protein n=1 Tax=Hexamita inflata TaxID=28002 RepID=A0AA86PRJ4_9EUKA|nr:Hypothetical protein HINF_LOCUS27865 [Hexamita inflata]
MYIKFKKSLIFEENFKKRGLQLKWKSKSDMKYALKTARFALIYRPLDIFWEIRVCKQGCGSAFEVMQYKQKYFIVLLVIIFHLSQLLRDCAKTKRELIIINLIITTQSSEAVYTILDSSLSIIDSLSD